MWSHLNYDHKKTRDVGLTFWCHLSNIMPDRIFHESMRPQIIVSVSFWFFGGFFVFVCLFVCFFVFVFLFFCLFVFFVFFVSLFLCFCFFVCFFVSLFVCFLFRFFFVFFVGWCFCFPQDRRDDFGFITITSVGVGKSQTTTDWSRWDWLPLIENWSLKHVRGFQTKNLIVVFFCLYVVYCF